MSADMREKPTPGPWRAFIGDGNTIAIMKGKSSTKEVIKWTGFDGSDFPQHARANARLIAAAPTLLAALKLCLAALDGGQAYNAACAAIDQAEGRAESASANSKG